MSVDGAISAFALRGARRGESLRWLAYSGGLTAVLLLLAQWICAVERVVPVDEIPWSTIGMADVFAIWLLGIAGFVVAPALVAATVAEERRQGTLDQLRTTPLPPLGLLAGLVVGGPARLYLLCAGPLAIHVAATVMGEVQPDALVASTVVLLVGTLASSTGALCLAMARRQETAGGLVALGVAALGAVASTVALAFASGTDSVPWAFLHPAGALDASMLMHDGLWRRLMVSTWALERFADLRYSTALTLAPALGFVFWMVAGALLARAGCRKLERPQLPLFSKRQAILLFALCAAGFILPFDLTHEGTSIGRVAPFGYGLALLPVALALAAFSTPEFEAWALALRRPGRAVGFSDEAPPHRAALVMVGIFVIFLYYKFHANGFPSAMRAYELGGFAWGIWLALALPIFLLFGATRFHTAASRFAFGAATAAWVVLQVIDVGLFISSKGLPGEHDSIARLTVEAGAILALVVPAWIAAQQQRMRREIIERT